MTTAAVDDACADAGEMGGLVVTAHHRLICATRDDNDKLI
jgi:hypothetical protein